MFWKLLSVAITAMTMAFLVSDVAYAWVGYHGSWAARPTEGEWYWNNNHPNSDYVSWNAHHKWNGAAAYNIWNDYVVWAKVYHFEYEAYKPGSPAYFCENFEAESFYTGNLPVHGYPEWRKECGSSLNNEVRVWIDGSRIAANTAYGNTMHLRKRHPISAIQNQQICSGHWHAEVNLSFSYLWSDDWLGKVYYAAETYGGKLRHDKCGDDPLGLVY